MKSSNYRPDPAKSVAVIFILLLSITNGAFAQDDEWGSVSTSEPEEKSIVDDVAKDLIKGEKVYTIFVKNGLTETMIIRHFKLVNIKLGDATFDQSNVKIEPHKETTIRVLPGEQKNLMVVKAKPEFGDLKLYWNYKYHTSNTAVQVAGKPTEGVDYAVYSEVDTITKHVTYFAHNFSDKPLSLKGVLEFAEDDYGMDWERNSVITGTSSDFFKSKTVYSGPEKPETIAPGKSVIVWKDAYMDYDYYPYISPVLDIEFSKSKSRKFGK